MPTPPLGWMGGGPLPSIPLPSFPKKGKRRQYRMTGGVSDLPQPGTTLQRDLTARTASSRFGPVSYRCGDRLPFPGCSWYMD